MTDRCVWCEVNVRSEICECFSKKVNRTYPALEGERVAARRVAVAAALPALAAEQHVAGPKGG